MPRDITMKQLRIFTAVCAFSLSMAQVKAEDQFLVDEGKAYAEIIISESPARSTRLEVKMSCVPFSLSRIDSGGDTSGGCDTTPDLSVSRSESQEQNSWRALRPPGVVAL